MSVTCGAFTYATANTYTVATSATSAALGSATGKVISPTINGNEYIFENRKFPAGFTVDSSNQYSDVEAHLDLQISHDGSNWVTVDTLSTDCTPNVAGVKVFEADLEDYYAPYYRFVFNDEGLNVGTTGQGQFFWAAKKV